MKRQQMIVMGCGGLLAVLCGVAGWLLFHAASAKAEAAAERNMNYEDLQQIYQAPIFPNEANISRVREDQTLVEAWLGTASNLLHQGDLPITKMTPAGFKQDLQRSVRDLSSYPGVVNGKIVAPNFYFGFDRYLGQSDSLPDSAHVDRLAFQMAVIEKLCKELYLANIMELRSVEREVFDDATKSTEAAVSSRRRRRRDDTDTSRQPATRAPADADHGYFSKQRFTLEFMTRPPAFIEVLNRLAAMDLFAVVAEVELRKTGDPLSARELAARKDSRAAPADAQEAAVDPATLTHMERVITDPEREPPVNVKLEIDVYSFEGV